MTTNIIEKYKIIASLTAPLHVGGASGDKSEVLMHPVSDQPFLQASGVAGALRAASVKINGEEQTRQLFGSSMADDTSLQQEVSSKLRFSDGIFTPDTIKMECRPRVKIDPYTGSVSSSVIAGSGHHSGHKFEMEFIGQGAELTFYAYLFHGKEDADRGLLEKIFAELAAQHVQIGGQRSNGSGILELKQLLHHRFDMTRKEDRKVWSAEYKMDEESDASLWYDDITDTLPDPRDCAQAYELCITGKTEGALLVKGASVADFGEGAPKAENMKNVAEQYIIPGSSLKGALRGRMAFAADRLHKKKIIQEIFGSSGDGTKPGCRGNIMVKDTIIEEEKAVLQHRLHIDKFTAGVIQLFADKTIAGNVLMNIEIEDRHDPEATVGLAILAVRDLAEGLWNVGSGYSIGRGFISVKNLSIHSFKNNSTTVIDFEKDRIDDPDGQISTFLQALEQWGDSEDGL